MNSQMKQHTRRGLEDSSLCPCGVGVCQRPASQMCAPTWKLPKLHATGNFMEPSSHRHDRLLPHSPVLSPSPEVEGGRQGPKVPGF